MHEIELEQRRLREEIPLDATVGDAVAQMLGVGLDDELVGLIARQLRQADSEVDGYVRAMRNVRRSAVAVGFVSGVSFAVAAARAKAAEPGE